MKTKEMISIFFLVLISLVATTMAGEARVRPGIPDEEISRDIPPIINSTLYRTSPTFVSADLAFDEDGSPNERVLGELATRALNNDLDNFRRGALDRTDCVPYGPVWVERVTSIVRSTLRAAAQTSDLVLEGTVVARDYGFYRGMIPGQLLKVATRQVLRGKPMLDWHYVFYPVAEFQAGPYVFCKTDHRYPEPPEPGDQVVLMIHKVFDEEEPVLHLRDEHSIVILGEGGEARFSGQFKEDRSRRFTRKEILSEIERGLEGQ